MQPSLFAEAPPETIRDRMGYPALDFSIQGQAPLDERDWSKYAARLGEIRQPARGEGGGPKPPEAAEALSEGPREGRETPPDDLYRLKLAFPNNQYAEESIAPLRKALQSTPCIVIWPYAGKGDGGYGATLHVIGTEEWLRGAASILKDLQAEPSRWAE